MAQSDEILAAVRGTGCPVTDLLSDAELFALLVTLEKALFARGFVLVRWVPGHSADAGPVN